ncbi:hypothetical protein B0H11DRAFT_2122734 [Mycena galericulata]|nr:hypothetical protein B0H11DRAFT_2122734 [Mycena galericulata]
MARNDENAPVATSGARGSSGHGKRTASKNSTTTGRPKKNSAVQEAQLEIARLKEQLAKAEAANKERAARGAAGSDSPEEDIVPIQRPKGEAGDRKKGFCLIEAMGLEDKPEDFLDIQRAVHINVVRAHLDVKQDYRKQDPGKLAAAFKLTRKQFSYLNEKRFPMNWAIAEMVKQFLRNKRRYGVRRGTIPNREMRKRQAEDNTAVARKRRKTMSGNVPHIDEQEDDSGNDDEDNDGGDGEADGADGDDN